MSGAVRDLVLRLRESGKSNTEISRTVSLPIYDVERVR